MTLRLSVLDQSPVGETSSREEAVRSTVRLATALDGLGYAWPVVMTNGSVVAGPRSEKGSRRCQVQRFPRAIETCLRDRSSLILLPFDRMEVLKAV